VPYGYLIEGASSYGTAEFMLNKAKNGENISLFGDGGVRRTLTYIGDLCRILIEGAISAKCKNDVFNIGGEDYSLKEMASLIADKYGVGIDYVEYPELAEKIESGDTVFDDNKLKEHLPLIYETTFLKWCKGH
jgi:UDP-glucose 4-epimerase